MKSPRRIQIEQAIQKGIIQTFDINGKTYIALPDAYVEDCFLIRINIDDRYSSVLIPLDEIK